MRCLLLLLLLAPTAAAEDVSPLTYTSRRVQNIKQPSGTTTIHTSSDISIRMALRPTGMVDVVANGTDDFSVVTPTKTSLTFRSDVDATWTTTWVGTWTERNGERVLDLELAIDSCKKSESFEDGLSNPVPCAAPSKRATVVCKSERVSAAVPKTQKKRAHAAWRCSVTQGSLGPTPVPWVVGNTQCIETKIDANGAMSFVEC